MSFAISRLDAHDDAQFDAYYAAYLAGHSREIDSPHTYKEVRAHLSSSSDFVDHIALMAHQQSDVFATAYLEIPLKDNLNTVFMTGATVPKFRNRGFGSALVAEVESFARRLGRPKVWTETLWGLHEPESESRAFLERRGYTLDLTDALRVLDLPWTFRDPRLNDHYRLETFASRVPDQWVEQYAHLLTVITSEAPSGEIGLENENYDVARIRFEESQLKDLGRTKITTVAVSKDGTLAGHTQLVVDEDDENVYQWDTLVLKEHRGSGLGYSLKVHNLNQARELCFGKKQVRTFNAADNRAMIAVNESLGYKHVAHLGEYIKFVN